MATFSEKSLERLSSCDGRLQRLFLEVVKHYDCTVICGHRGAQEQTEAVRSGHSKLSFPKSKHNSLPSKAVDVIPFPVDWNDIKRFMHFAGFVSGVAKSMNIEIRWGGDFNEDLNFKNDNFFDAPHFEIKE